MNKNKQREFHKINLADLLLLGLFIAILIFLRLILFGECSRIKKADIAIEIPSNMTRGFVYKNLGDKSLYLIFDKNQIKDIYGKNNSEVFYKIVKDNKTIESGFLSLNQNMDLLDISNARKR